MDKEEVTFWEMPEGLESIVSGFYAVKGIEQGNPCAVDLERWHKQYEAKEFDQAFGFVWQIIQSPEELQYCKKMTKQDLIKWKLKHVS